MRPALLTLTAVALLAGLWVLASERRTLSVREAAGRTY